MTQRIKELRKQKQMTLLQLANAIGVSEGTAQRYESGNIRNIKYDTIIALARALDTTPSHLMGWNDTDTAEYLSITQSISKLTSYLQSLRNDPSNYVDEIVDESGTTVSNYIAPDYEVEEALGVLYEDLCVFLSEHNIRTHSYSTLVDDDEILLLDKFKQLNSEGRTKAISYITDLIASALYNE